LTKVPTYGGDTLHLEEGWQDWDTGIVYHNIFAADKQGFKLNSKLIFTKDEVRIHKNFYWAEKYFDFDFDYDLLIDRNIMVFQSIFMAAYTITRGDIIITGLTEVILNLEHTEPSPNPLPELNLGGRFGVRNPNVIPFYSILPEWQQKIDSYVAVLNQLTGLGKLSDFGISEEESRPLDTVNKFFLNLLNDGIIYTIEGFKTNLRKLGLNDADFALLTRGIIQADGSFLPSGISKKEFYSNWLTVIKNDLSGGL